MGELIGYLVVFVVFLLLGSIFGTANEKRHLASLRSRRKEYSDIQVSQVKSFPGFVPGSAPPRMLNAEVTIASDYLKSFLAGLRNLFGGEVQSFQTMLDRAREESLMKILARAKRLGYTAVCNVRFENADVGGNSTKRKASMVSIIASGTAYYSSGSR